MATNAKQVSEKIMGTEELHNANETSICRERTSINSPHGEAVFPILDKARLSVDCVGDLEVTAQSVDIDPGCWFIDLVITEKKGRQQSALPETAVTACPLVFNRGTAGFMGREKFIWKIKTAHVMPLLLFVSGSRAVYFPIKVPFGTFSLMLKVMVGAVNSGPSSTSRTVTTTGTVFQVALVPLRSGSLRAKISSFTVLDFS